MLGGGKYRGPSRIRWLIIGLVIGLILGMVIGNPNLTLGQVATNPSALMQLLPSSG